MIGLLLPILARWGVPESVRRPLAIATLIIAAIALSGAAIALFFHFHDKHVIERHDDKREAQANGARETAAAERVNDAVTNAKNEEDLHHAIDAAPTTGALSPAAHALACQRLLKLGRIPAGCRSSGGDGGQANPH